MKMYTFRAFTCSLVQTTGWSPILMCARRRIAALIHAGQNADVGSRRLVVGVPLLIFDGEVGWLDFSSPGASGASTVTVPVTKVGMYFGETNAAHEGGEPGPHRVAVELAQQSCMMKADPSAAAFFDISLESLPLPSVSTHREGNSAE